jgi:2-polyprenyl-6-methoxyphenol hydroxylase-like FAD-dependent oxidoreductase
VVVIRIWMEPASAGTRDDALRARIITAKDPDLSVEETRTVVGADGVLTVVRELLAELADGDERC